MVKKTEKTDSRLTTQRLVRESESNSNASFPKCIRVLF